MSSYELAKEYLKPIDNESAEVSDEHFQEYQDIQARKKLAKTSKSKGNMELDFAVGDMIEILMHWANTKRGERSAPKICL